MKQGKIFLLSFNSTINEAIAIGPHWLNDKEQQINALEKAEGLPFDFTLKNQVLVNGRYSYNDDFSQTKIIWADLQRNNKGWLLFSERLKNLICEHQKSGDSIKWISCNVIHGEEKRKYYIPLFMKEMDLLDNDTSQFYYADKEKILIKPVFSISKTQSYSFFSIPTNSGPYWRLSPGAYVVEELKNAIVKANMTGIVFDKVAVSD